MSATVLLIGGIILFLVAYTAYGGWLARQWGIDPEKETPAHTMYDGVDYVPAKTPILFGHHFASIAGAGPINGPVLAAVFGWVPVVLWIVIGSIFFGAVQDFGSLLASVRHKGKSIGDIIEVNVGLTGKRLFLIFAWCTLVLLVASFANVVADTFVATPQAATASLLFIPLAMAFGFFVYRRNASITVSTIVGVAILFLCIVIGYYAPLSLTKLTWIAILSAYIFFASVLPVWILLQPRDYLNSFLLYAMLIGGIIGILIYNPHMQLPTFTGFKVGGQFLFPMVFVTVACGAISGFHSIVASGTTAKQLDNEKNAQLIGFGGMLTEGVVAIIAIITAAYLSNDKFTELLKVSPVNVFADGLGNFMTSFGLNFTVGKTFTALAISAFVLTTLDTATRLARYTFQEFFENISTTNVDTSHQNSLASFLRDRFVSTIITVVISVILAFTSWKTIWPMFGSANQLLAALALLAVAAWLANIGKNNSMLFIPMIFMFIVTLTALVFLIRNNIASGNFLLVIIAALLFVLAIVLIIQTYGVLTGKSKKTPLQM